MKKLKLYIILLVVLHLNYPLHSQTYKVKDTILRTTQTQNAIYQARDRIEFGPGFVFDSQDGTGKTFKAEIREDLSFPSEYTTNTVEPGLNYNISTDLKLGMFGGTIEVGQSGAAMYTIPLTIAPGTNQMTPELSINYNSQSDNGIAGWGWSISGISSIFRTGKSKYHDSEIGGVNLDNNDRFIMDGQRLMLFSGEYGKNGSEYRTEQESFSKITAIGDFNGAPVYFLVHKKDGTKIYYGLNDNSRVVLADGTQPNKYMINRIEDPNGNYIKYNYSFDNVTKENCLSSIEYTGNDAVGLKPYNKIEFYYDLRQDNNIVYIAGIRTEKNKILRKIRVTGETQTLFTYEFKYIFDNNYTKLNEIYCYNSAGEKMNPIVVNYGTKTDNLKIIPGNFYTRLIIDNIEHQGQSFYFGDFNNDGISDLIIVYSYIPPSEKQMVNSMLRVFLGDGTGNYEKQYYYQLTFEKNWNNTQIYVRDFNNDGYDDILMCSRSGIKNDGRYIISVLFGTPDGLPHQDYRYYLSGRDDLPFNIYFTKNRFISEFHVDDFDGDGLPDILVELTIKKSDINYNAYDVHIIKAYDESFKSIICDKYIAYNGSEQNNNCTLDLQDINNNGKTNLIISSKADNNTYIYEYSSRETGFSIIKTWYGFPTYWHKKFFGDFNSDGYPDLLTWVNDKGDRLDGLWQIALNDGKMNLIVNETSFACPIVKKVDPDYNGTAKDCNYYLLDVNNDGMCDITEFYIVEDAQKVRHCEMNIYYGTGAGFYRKNFYIDQTEHLSNTKKAKWLNVDGDGYPDMIFAAYYYTQSPKIICLHPSNDDKLVRQIVDGLGNHLNIDYTSCVNSSSYIPEIPEPSQNPVLSYPLMTKTLPINVVKSINDENSGITSIFKYTKSVINLNSKSFLGFLRREKYENEKGLQMVNDYAVNRFNNIYLKKSTTGCSYMPMTTITFEYSFLSPYSNSKIYISQLNSKEITENMMGSTERHVYSGYDQYQNPKTYVKTILNRDYQIITCDSTEVKSYTDSGSWCKHKPTNTTITMTRKDAGQQITRRKIDAYDTKGNLTKENYCFSGTGTTDNDYTVDYISYNTLGLYAVKQTTGINSKRSIVCSYDDKGRIIKEVDPLGNVTSRIYDVKNSNVLIETDPDGHNVINSYDNSGILVSTKDKYGVNTVKTLDWCANLPQTDVPAFPAGALWYEKIHTSGKPEEYKFYDKKCLELRIATRQPEIASGQWLYTDKTYDALGRIVSEYLPYLSNETAGKCKQNRYIPSGIYAGRLQRETRPDGTYTVYNYMDNVTLVEVCSEEKSVVTFRKIDETGLVIEASDPAGTIYYTYHSDGNVKDISYGSTLYQFKYDKAGNRIELHDPAAGIVKTKYNIFNELIAQQSAAQAQDGTYHKIEYDPLGRLIKKSLIRGDYNTQSGSPIEQYYYTYGAENNILELKEERSENGKKMYEYDISGRLKTITEQILNNGNPEKTFRFEYQYDEYGRVIKEIYPEDFVLINTYDRSGYISGIKTQNSQQVYQPIAYNKNGAIRSYMVNGIFNTNKNFDDVGRVTMIRTSTNSTIRQNMYYQYTPDGNMAFRADYLVNKKEWFIYDDLNRLTGSKITPVQSYVGLPVPVTIMYDNNRISSKAGIGDYQYGNNGSNAVEKVKAGNMASMINPSDCLITYTPGLKIKTITEGNKFLEYKYGVDDDRVKRTYTQNGVTKTKYYGLNGLYELNVDESGNETHNYYINGQDGVVALYIKMPNDNNHLCALLKDHLGSIVSIIENCQGSVTEYEKFSYDAWGRRRNAENWTYEDVYSSTITDRGFCFHEHLDEFNLINMGGRTYDPLLGVFLSPDTYAQAPDCTQGLNRYAYCFNNPLRYTDQNGELVITMTVGAIIGVAVLGGVINVVIMRDKIDNFVEGAAAFAVGALAGAVTAIGGVAGACIAVVGSAITFAVNEIIEQLTPIEGWDKLKWGEIGGMAVTGLVVGAITFGMDKLFGMILPKETFKNLSLTSKLTTSFTKGTMEGAVAGVIDGVGGGIVKDEWDKVGEKTFNSAIGGGIMSMGSVGLNQIFKNNKSNTKTGKNTPQIENELIPDINSSPETNVTSFPKTESPVTHPNGKYLPAIIPSQNLMLNPSNTVIPNRPQVIRQNLLPQRH